jgi:hypothetical protein
LLSSLPADASTSDQSLSPSLSAKRAARGGIMPRFFFHLEDGLGTASEPVELADLTAARETALRFIGQSLVDRPGEIWALGKWRLTVSDEGRMTLFAIDVVATEAPSVRIEVLPNPVA